MSLMKVSGVRGGDMLLNLKQLAWASLRKDRAGNVTRVTLHMADGAIFPIEGDEVATTLEALQAELGLLPDTSTP